MGYFAANRSGDMRTDGEEADELREEVGETREAERDDRLEAVLLEGKHREAERAGENREAEEAETEGAQTETDIDDRGDDTGNAETEGETVDRDELPLPVQVLKTLEEDDRGWTERGKLAMLEKAEAAIDEE